MDIELLREFVYLAEHLSFSNTAYHFFISQSTLSKHILRLEKEAGCPLFVRDTQSVTITPYGKMLYEDAIDIVSQYDHAINRLRKQRQNESDTNDFQIGYPHLFYNNFLTQGIRKFINEFPKIDISHRVYYEMDEIYNALKNGDIDIAFALSSDRLNDQKFEFMILFKNSFKVLVSPEHRLADRISVTPSDLEGEICISPNDNFSIFSQNQLASVFKAAHVNISFLARPFHAETGILLAQQGKCIAIVPQCFTVNPTSTVKSPILDCDVSIDTIMVWKRLKRNRLIDSFARNMQEISSVSNMVQS